MRNISNVDATREKSIINILKAKRNACTKVYHALRCKVQRVNILTLGVRRSFAGFLETWFLTFLHAGIAGEQALFA